MTPKKGFLQAAWEKCVNINHTLMNSGIKHLDAVRDGKGPWIHASAFVGGFAAMKFLQITANAIQTVAEKTDHPVDRETFLRNKDQGPSNG